MKKRKKSGVSSFLGSFSHAFGRMMAIRTLVTLLIFWTITYKLIIASIAKVPMEFRAVIMEAQDPLRFLITIISLAVFLAGSASFFIALPTIGTFSRTSLERFSQKRQALNDYQGKNIFLYFFKELILQLEIFALFFFMPIAVLWYGVAAIVMSGLAVLMVPVIIFIARPIAKVMGRIEKFRCGMEEFYTRPIRQIFPWLFCNQLKKIRMLWDSMMSQACKVAQCDDPII